MSYEPAYMWSHYPAAVFLLFSNKGFIPSARIYVMGIGRYMVKELARELDNRSREFYEFVMPAIDMVSEDNELVVTIDLPGFAKKDISLKIKGNILSISAKRDVAETTGTVYQRHRPQKIDKKVILPLQVKEDEKVVGKATYADGVVTLRIPMPSGATNIPIT
jgi:HSP20 family molecular chaperone IbpA